MMLCKHCKKAVYWVPQHLGHDILVHEGTGLHHCETNWEESRSVRAGLVAEVEKAAA